jgi:hypothetical protein
MYSEFQLAKAIQTLVPGAQFTFSGTDLSTMVWMSQDLQQPTAEAILAEAAKQAYIPLRVAAYPPVQQLADALVHQANGDPAPLTAYIAACNAVKAQYPKPS